MVKFLHQQNLKPLRVWNFFVSARSCWTCGVRWSKSFTFSSVQSAGKPIEEAVTLHASFRTFMTFSLAILLVNLQTTGLRLEVAFLVGIRWAISISWIEISTPAAWKRLRHSVVVSEADSLVLIFRETDDLYAVFITVALNQLNGFPNLFYSFRQDI